MNRLVKIVAFLILIAFGAFMIVFGEKDDSPGAQGLGLLAVIGGSVGIVKRWKGRSHG